MIQEITLFLVGIFLLVKGADYLVRGSSSLASRLKIPTIIIGITIVAIGTTMPELVVNIIAALEGNPEIGFGNIIGSNIANILLVLGITALIHPIKIERDAIWKEIPITLIAVVVLFVISNSAMIDGLKPNTVTRTNGLIMLTFFAVFIYYTVEIFRQTRKKLEKEGLNIGDKNRILIAVMILGGLIGLFIGGKWTVDGAVFFAEYFGLSQFLISATIIAIGTSLPELATAITAAKRKDTGFIVGNVAGANIFNIFWILGITALIAPIAVPAFINADIIFMGIATLILLALIFIGKTKDIERWEGGILLGLYIAYLVFIGVRG